MNDFAVFLQKEKILCAIVMFRNLTRSERFSLPQIVVARLQSAQLTPRANYCEYSTCSCRELEPMSIGFNDLFTSISYVSVALSTKAAETEIRAVYRAHAYLAKSKKAPGLARPFLAHK